MTGTQLISCLAKEFAEPNLPKLGPWPNSTRAAVSNIIAKHNQIMLTRVRLLTQPIMLHVQFVTGVLLNLAKQEIGICAQTGWENSESVSPRRNKWSHYDVTLVLSHFLSPRLIATISHLSALGDP